MSELKFTDRAVDSIKMEISIPSESRESEYWCATFTIEDPYGSVDEYPVTASISLNKNSLRRLRDSLNEANI
jgi:hypothetical protein